MPVDYDEAGGELRRLLRSRPRALLMFGLGAGRRRLGIESVALNIDHCEVPRWKRGPRRIGPGPLALPARVPFGRILRGLRRARIPAERSFHAGTFICNHVFYVGLSTTRIPCGFIHVPPTRTISLARQLRAAEVIRAAVVKG